MPARIRPWLEQHIYSRLTPATTVYLTRKNIFIVPARAGAAFLLLIALLWLVATNYENNPIFALTFLLLSLFIVGILHTFGNLAGLEVTAIKSKPAFVGEDAEFTLLVRCNNRHHYENILFNWPDMPPTVVNLAAERQQQVRLFAKAKQRGWMQPGRLLVETRYPLGLFRAWTRMALNLPTLVYPRPVYAGPIPAAPGGSGNESITVSTGAEDFYGLKEYQPGDSLRHVAWKHYARQQGLYSKEYAAAVDRQLWLDWDYLAGMGREERLSRLCYWVLEASRAQQNYGLRLPGIEIAPGQGVAHRDQLLQALALFEWDQQQ